MSDFIINSESPLIHWNVLWNSKISFGIVRADYSHIFKSCKLLPDMKKINCRFKDDEPEEKNNQYYSEEKKMSLIILWPISERN